MLWTKAAATVIAGDRGTTINVQRLAGRNRATLEQQQADKKKVSEMSAGFKEYMGWDGRTRLLPFSL